MCRRLLVTFLISALLLPGCWDMRPVEDLSMYLGLAIDLAPNGKDLIITASQPEFHSLRQEDVKASWAQAADLGRAIHLLQLQEARTAVAGKVILYLFGEEFWKSGRLVEFARSAYARSDMSLTGLVACVKGRAGDILRQRPEEMTNPAEYTWSILTSGSAHGFFPRTSLLHIARRRPLNQDMWLVLIKPEKELKTVRSAGSVVFSGLYPVAELSVPDTMDLMWVSGQSVGQSIEIGEKWFQGGTISATITSAALKSKRNHGAGKIDIDVKSECKVQVHYPPDLSKASGQAEHELASAISSELDGRGKRLVERLRGLDSDPLGLTKPGPFTNAETAKKIRDMYKDTRISYKASATIEILGGE